jgi:hypothetical protein
MLSAALIFISLIIGYVVVVALAGLSAFAITSYMPAFAVQNGRLSTSYNLLLDLMWLLYSFLGGYIAAAGAAEASPHIAAGLLALALIGVMWTGLAEARQRGLIHLFISTACVVAGIAAGYIFRMQQIQ